MHDSLIEGRKYKVCLKPFEELLALGLAEDCDEGYPWYEYYLCRDVGCVTLPSQEELKILGEV